MGKKGGEAPAYDSQQAAGVGDRWRPGSGKKEEGHSWNWAGGMGGQRQIVH
jgi:hypothetical protein